MKKLFLVICLSVVSSPLFAFAPGTTDYKKLIKVFNPDTGRNDFINNPSSVSLADLYGVSTKTVAGLEASDGDALTFKAWATSGTWVAKTPTGGLGGAGGVFVASGTRSFAQSASTIVLVGPLVNSVIFQGSLATVTLSLPPNIVFSSNVTAGSGSLHASTTTLQSEINAFSGFATTSDVRLDNLDGSTASFRTFQSTAGALISGLTSSTQSFRTYQSTADARMNVNSSSITTAWSNFYSYTSTADSRMDALKNSSTTLQSQINSFSTFLTTANTSIDNLNSATATFRTFQSTTAAQILVALSFTATGQALFDALNASTANFRTYQSTADAFMSHLNSTSSWTAPQVYGSSVTFSSSTLNIGGVVSYYATTIPASGDQILHRTAGSSVAYWGGQNPTGVGGGGGSSALNIQPGGVNVSTVVFPAKDFILNNGTLISTVSLNPSATYWIANLSLTVGQSSAAVSHVVVSSDLYVLGFATFNAQVKISSTSGWGIITPPDLQLSNSPSDGDLVLFDLANNKLKASTPLTNVVQTTSSSTFSSPVVFGSSTTFSSSTINIGGVMNYFQSTAAASGDQILHRIAISSSVYWGGQTAAGAAVNAQVYLDTGTLAGLLQTTATQISGWESLVNSSTSSLWTSQLSTYTALTSTSIAQAAFNNAVNIATSNLSNQEISGGANLTYFPHNEQSSTAPYKLLGSTPAAGGEFARTKNVTSALGLVVISSHITNIGDPGLNTLPAGIWDFTTWANEDLFSGLTQLVITVSTVSFDGTVVTEILSSTSTGLTTAQTTRYNASVVQQNDISVSTTDRILVRYAAFATAIGGVNVTVLFGGTSHYTHVETPISQIAKPIAVYSNGSLLGNVNQFNFTTNQTVSVSGTQATVSASGGGGGTAATLQSPATGPYDLNSFSIMNASGVVINNGGIGALSIATSAPRAIVHITTTAGSNVPLLIISSGTQDLFTVTSTQVYISSIPVISVAGYEAGSGLGSGFSFFNDRRTGLFWNAANGNWAISSQGTVNLSNSGTTSLTSAVNFVMASSQLFELASLNNSPALTQASQTGTGLSIRSGSAGQIDFWGGSAGSKIMGAFRSTGLNLGGDPTAAGKATLTVDSSPVANVALVTVSSAGTQALEIMGASTTINSQNVKINNDMMFQTTVTAWAMFPYATFNSSNTVSTSFSTNALNGLALLDGVSGSTSSGNASLFLIGIPDNFVAGSTPTMMHLGAMTTGQVTTQEAHVLSFATMSTIGLAVSTGTGSSLLNFSNLNFSSPTVIVLTSTIGVQGGSREIKINPGDNPLNGVTNMVGTGNCILVVRDVRDGQAANDPSNVPSAPYGLAIKMRVQQ